MRNGKKGRKRKKIGNWKRCVENNGRHHVNVPDETKHGGGRAEARALLSVCILSLLWVNEVMADVTASESHAHHRRGGKSPACCSVPPS